MNAENRLMPPPRWLQWAEWRSLGELATTLLTSPWLASAPRGDGHPVIVLPGLMCSDRSTLLLRNYLRRCGHDVQGWSQGRNLGPRPGVHEAMLSQLDRLYQRSGRKVSLIGWSLGGLYALQLAHQRPDAVRNVVTLGSPIGGQPRATRAWRLYEFTSGQRADAPVELPAPGTVPTSSIWSRGDGIVAWRNSLQPPAPRTENIEVYASHLGLGVNATVLYAVADRLAQPEAHWQPFVPPARLRAFYPRRALNPAQRA